MVIALDLGVYHKDEKTSTYPYISFRHDYNFQKYPSNFTYELIDNKSYLSKKIDFINLNL